MTSDQATELLDAMVDLLGTLAVADEAKARLPGDCHPVQRALRAVHRAEGGFMPPALRDMAARVERRG